MFCIWDYRMYKKTGDNKYRERAFKQIDYLFKAQQPGGVFHTTLNLNPRKGVNAFGHNHTQPDKPYEDYCSADHGHDAYKPDINAMTGCYLLKFWKMLKDNNDDVIGKEKLQEIYDRAVKCLDYVLAQQNEDGGFSQCVDITMGKRAVSTVCGRTMVAFPYATETTGDRKYLDAALKAEKFLCENVQNKFWYTGAHPDLPPEDFEQDSIFNVIEYWLDKYDRTKEQDALDNAVANAYYALLGVQSN
jgi:rhamnogalacturonyl hydrolase YesR